MLSGRVTAASISGAASVCLVRKPKSPFVTGSVGAAKKRSIGAPASSRLSKLPNWAPARYVPITVDSGAVGRSVSATTSVASRASISSVVSSVTSSSGSPTSAASSAYTCGWSYVNSRPITL
jgi:hypothetical protein